ncbi:MAG: toll/interleukin-1 receptor domain-containing protein [Desulfobacteraceae bacterium]|nr:toll/interleukin-1 receptor domain-containing protein [Desulfobacteraceae bacterium]
MSAKIFISYGEEDHSIAKRLYDDLKASGFKPWIRSENILVGQKLKLEIRKAIQESSYFLILLSEKSLSDRGYFHKELKTAQEIFEEMPPDKIFILPVRLDACKPPYENLQDIQHTDLFPPYEKGFRQIVQALESPGDEKENRRFVDKRVLGTLAGIRIESGEDSVFAKDSGKAGIVKDSHAGVVGDSAKVEGGIHQHTQKAEGTQWPVQADRVEQHFYQDKRLWTVVIALVCLIPVLVFVIKPDIRNKSHNIKAGGDVTVIHKDGISPEEFRKLSEELGVNDGRKSQLTYNNQYKILHILLSEGVGSNSVDKPLKILKNGKVYSFEKMPIQVQFIADGGIIKTKRWLEMTGRWDEIPIAYCIETDELGAFIFDENSDCSSKSSEHNCIIVVCK